MFEKYIEVRSWLETFIPLVYGKEELGLARIENLLEKLGNPHKKFKSVHVAGTSGKGSTAFYISKMLQLSVLGSQLSDGSQSVSQLSDKLKTGRPKSGSALQNLSNRKQKTDNWKIGLHVSPHLVDIRERMQIFSSYVIPAKAGIKKEGILDQVEDDNLLMPMGRFLKLFEQVRPVVEKIQKEKPELAPSYFEILVAGTFKYFAEEKVDWAVVEVGLGGRLDATNVLQSRIAVITNIGLDHTEILGDTIEKIAFEKAGIIKPGVPVVTGATGKALRVIEKAARGKGAKVIRVKASKGQSARNLNLLLAEKAVEVVLSLRGPRSVHMNVGRGNLETRDSFASLRMTEEEVKGFGLGLPGRFEEVEPGVILDGAHNPDKIRALLDFVRKSFFLRHSRVNENPDPRFREDDSMVDDVILVLAFKKGKNWQQMVDLLVKNLPVVQAIATEFNTVTDTGKFGAVSGKEIKDYLDTKYTVPCDNKLSNKILDTKYFLNSQEAVFNAINSNLPFAISHSNSEKLKAKGLVLVTGSLYLVGEVRTMWRLPTFA